MSYEGVYQRLGLRMSEEFQLLAEQKWILGALNKIKNQRNCLQIERLHLESMKSMLKKNSKLSMPASPESQVPEEEIKEPTDALNLMQNSTAKGTEQNEVEELRLDGATVNDEELDLLVNNAVFDMNLNQDIDMEEDDEEENNDDMFIDMNMFMNGVPSRF
ncbi:uncharacterized protein LOC123876977 [Maniola jurtina]|uniref:uncharacterized protein LOC123876977 n=1 Tax=Maniola jurtina TaxID=191418 RepID=UPI001E68B8BF|nr:uncharacterized protein LOC123876977 [Maniola jurtina]XP_045779406.1 uncharacterized protein LOC123876977 [Maniola jurtina]